MNWERKKTPLKFISIINICDPTQLNEMLSGGQIVFFLSKYFTGIKDHFGIKLFWYHFPLLSYEKNKYDILEFSEFKNSCFKQVKVLGKQVNQAGKQHSMETSFSGHDFTPLRYLSWRICAKGHLRPIIRIWHILTLLHIC